MYLLHRVASLDFGASLGAIRRQSADARPNFWLIDIFQRNVRSASPGVIQWSRLA
jgi:hypothetical protein